MNTHFVTRHEGRSYHFTCFAIWDGVPINPRLPKNFSDTANESRPPRHMALWGIPYIETDTGGHDTKEDRAKWLEAWPSGTRYDVRCLDGGAWDRPTCWGMFATIEEAVQCAHKGPRWREKGATT